MRRLIGPILHLRESTKADWRFSVGLWVEDPQPGQLTLTFDAGAQATTGGAPTVVGTFGLGLAVLERAHPAPGCGVRGQLHDQRLRRAHHL